MTGMVARQNRPYPYTPDQYEVLTQCADLLDCSMSEVYRRAGQALAKELGLKWPEYVRGA